VWRDFEENAEVTCPKLTLVFLGAKEKNLSNWPSTQYRSGSGSEGIILGGLGFCRRKIITVSILRG